VRLLGWLRSIPLDWVGCALPLIGMLLIAWKMRSGWLFCVASNTVWTYIGLTKKPRMYGLIVLSGVLVFVNLYGWWVWG
jgi:hypothetical protein